MTNTLRTFATAFVIWRAMDGVLSDCFAFPSRLRSLTNNSDYQLVGKTKAWDLSGACRTSILAVSRGQCSMSILAYVWTKIPLPEPRDGQDSLPC